MLSKETYKEWTKSFNPTSNNTSRFEGDWSEGSKMLFLGTDDKGHEVGMVSRIAKNIPYEFISIEHLGIVKDGMEDTTSEEATSWAPAFENYTFIEKNWGTEIVIDQDLDEQYIQMFGTMWKNALLKLKEIAEK